MAKTTFEHGTIVTPDFLNKIFKNGHVHDGGSDDGHCDKIDLETETSGNLSLDRTTGNISLDRTTGKLSINRIDERTVTTYVLVCKYFEDGSAFPQDTAVVIEPSYSNNKKVTLFLPEAIHSAGDSSRVLTGTFLPESARPDNFVYKPAMVVNNNVPVPGCIEISSSGVVKFYRYTIPTAGAFSGKLFLEENFESGGLIGWPETVVTYHLKS